MSTTREVDEDLLAHRWVASKASPLDIARTIYAVTGKVVSPFIDDPLEPLTDADVHKLAVYASLDTCADAIAHAYPNGVAVVTAMRSIAVAIARSASTATCEVTADEVLDWCSHALARVVARSVAHKPGLR